MTNVTGKQPLTAAMLDYTIPDDHVYKGAASGTVGRQAKTPNDFGYTLNLMTLGRD